MLLSNSDQQKAIKAGFREDLLKLWDGGPYVEGLKLFTAPNGKLKIDRFKSPKDLAARLQHLSREYNLSSHCLLVLRNAGMELSRQQAQRADVRAEKKTHKTGKGRKK